MARSLFTHEDQARFLESLVEEFGESATSKQILDFAEKSGVPIPYYILRDDTRKIGRGKYKLARHVDLARAGKFDLPIEAIVAPDDGVKFDKPVHAETMPANVIGIASKRAINVTDSFVPSALSTYVPFGFYTDLRNIINSKIFYPVYITGHSGNGKTLMVEQVCADLGREVVRVNITKRTDETDLIGSYELIDGNTVRREGPVITAMRRGAVLLLDEVDLGTEDLLCLQPILEGKPYFDKKTGEVITPVAGFQIIATSNTKGKGSDDGRYIGTNVLNEAMLERFAITVEQEYPDAKVERKILSKNFDSLGVKDDTFVSRLVQWAEVIRKSFADGAVDELISTRRLVHIAKAYAIFKDRMKAVELCLNRFDGETKTAFLDLYTKVDADVANSPVSDLPTSDKFATEAELLTAKFGTEVSIFKDDKQGAVIVGSHGRTTAILNSTLTATKSPMELLNATVERHQFLAP
jgi:MoxR-like ATPase